MARNNFSGYCYRCGEMCEPGEGYFEHNYGGIRVQHKHCQKRYKNHISKFQYQQAKLGNAEAIADVACYDRRVAKNRRKRLDVLHRTSVNNPNKYPKRLAPHGWDDADFMRKHRRR